MWIFTRFGFFSCTCPRESESLLARVDTSRIQIRSRTKAHLESLVAAYIEPFFTEAREGTPEIVHTPERDYPWRVFVRKDVFAAVMDHLALDLDYDNFKSEAMFLAGDSRDPYIQSLHSVWDRLYRITPSEERK